MATSGSVNYAETRNEIIKAALEKIRAYGVGKTISAADHLNVENQLNRMIKFWCGKGLHLWAKEEAYLFVTENVASYTLSDAAAAARAALQSDSVLTQLNGAAAASATSLTVESTTGMTVADAIGVVLADDTIHWSTIATIPGSTSLTINDALASAANDNAHVYTYTSRITKPLRILSMNRVTGMDLGATSTRSEVPMTLLAQDDYFSLANKSTNGASSHFYYNPNLTDGKLFLWPRPDNVSDYFEFTFERLIEDFDASTDNPDFPVEWLDPIVYNLAYRISPDFGKDKNLMQPEASEMLNDILNWDQEIGDVQIIGGDYR